MARLTFFVGKGGVGKTTLSGAYALATAASTRSQRVLLVSTDPAHSLSDVLQQPLAGAPVRIKGGPANVSAWQISASREFDAFLAEHREPMLQVVEQGTIFTRAEIEPFLDTALPGMAELAALISLAKLLEAQTYDHIVVDTAPFGHTLRLFQLPEQFQKLLRFLDAAVRRDESLAAHFGGQIQRPSVAFLERWHALFEQISSLLRSHDTKVMLVSSPEPLALQQSIRIMKHLQELAMQVEHVILNRVVPATNGCPICGRAHSEALAAQKFLRQRISRVPMLLAEDLGFPVMGAARLKAFGTRVFARKKAPLAPPRLPPTSNLALTPTEWPIGRPTLSFTLGKGGVGKTTISAGVAYATRHKLQRSHVTICSTDPAPSLDDIFLQAVGDAPVSVLGDRHLEAVEVDSVAAYQKFVSRLRRSLENTLTADRGGLHVELAYERDVLSALLDIMPPGVDELLGIMAITRILEKTGRRRLIVDMAPTGHALELLRMPERMLHWARLIMKILAAHRGLAVAQDVAVEVADLSQRIRGLVEIMRDPARCQILVVLLAEPLPDRETRRLLADLRSLKLPAHAVFVNRVHFSPTSECDRCATAAAWQKATLPGLAKGLLKVPLYVVPEFEAEISGRSGLARLTKQLWLAQVKKPRKRS